MTVPQRNHVPGFAPLGPNHHHQTPVEMPRRDEAGFAIVEAVIDNRGRQPGEHFAGAGEVEPAMLEREIALRR